MRALDLTAVTGAALIALAACSAGNKTLGGGGATSGSGGGQGGMGATTTSTTSGGQGGMGTSTASTGLGGMGASTTSTASSGQGGMGATTTSSGQGGMSTGGAGGAAGGQGGLGGGDAGPAVCMNGETCTVDLRLCPPCEEAASWQGRSSLQGTLELASYTTHFGWVCQVSTGGILQAWPVMPVPGWWCGTVIPACVCSPSDNCK
jgi:hypothetical protein